MVLTTGHQAVIRHVEETTAGTFPTNPALLLFTKETTRVRFFKDKDLKESLDMGDYEVDEFFNPRNTYGLEIEGHIYDVSRILNLWERTSTGAPRPYSFELIPNEDAATPTYYRGSGWRTVSCRITGRVGDAWVFNAVFVGGKWDAPTTSAPSVGSGSREAKSAITADLRHFASGAITNDAAAWAILVGAFEAVCEHGTEAQYTTGDKEPVALGTTWGKRKITGTADISLDDGAETHWDMVEAFADHTIIVPFGAAGQPKLTLSNVKLPRAEVELGADVNVVMGSQPWSAKTYTEGTV